MAADSNAQTILGNQATPTTVTTAAVTGAWVSLNTQPGTSRRGLTARHNFVNAVAATPGVSYQVQLQWSPDGTQAANLIASLPITPATTYVGLEPITLPFVLPATGVYVRDIITPSGTTGGPELVLWVDLMTEYPG
jgi:hypothetical protein